ncbi:MAG: lysine--tRNA ligase [Anaerolineae bacterium]
MTPRIVDTEEDFTKLQQVRLEKLERIREQGIDPYPPRVERTHAAAEALELFQAAEADNSLNKLPDELKLAGRLVSLRIMGRASFAHIQDGSGRIQIFLKQDLLGEDAYQFFKDFFDLGDFIAVTGRLFRTRTGEITLEVNKYQLLAKSLHPLPEKWHGLRDTELRYRQRYLDLLTNDETRRIFQLRGLIVKAMRQYLDDQGFLEVDTPVLQPLYGGAAARPFATHYNALAQDFYLRISDELYLKRLIIGGLDKVYEIGKDFRNEGLSTRHNPEFTMMECYWAYADYNDIMRLVENMVAFIARQVLRSEEIHYQGEKVVLTPPWGRISMRDAVKEATGIDIERYTTLEELQEVIQDRQLAVDVQPTWAKLVDELFSEFVEPALIQPTFITDYPVELSPLAKRKPDAPHLVERFEPFAGGLELGNAFTELNDPLDQRVRFEAMHDEFAAGDEEAHPLDEDFLTAMMYGMPPTGGLGIGVDRLVMLLTNQSSIREVILFPQLRTR